jgi:hypothetical protein
MSRGMSMSRLCFGVMALGAGACGSKALTRQQLLDPTNCGACHIQHFTDWTTSMHAYASDDPVFRAMNARGQRETAGQLGTFCVNCHAPMAVHEGATADGLNLDSVPASLHGVTCFFCHSVDEVDGGHDDPLLLATDLKMRAEITDPISNTAHASTYSGLLDREQIGSAPACGACHDIVNGHGTTLERTFLEWQGSVFSQATGGESCSECHMAQSPFTTPIAQFPGAPPRFFHAHNWPGVDVALPSPGAGPPSLDAGLGAANQSLLDDTLQAALCFEPATTSIKVILDNTGAGHSWPSGAVQDRRAWVEVVAWLDGGVVYESGVVPDGGSVTALNDPDLWLMRDCIFDDAGTQVDMFWQAASFEGNELPALVTFDQSNPAFFATHLIENYPGSGGPLGFNPDRITARVLIQPIGTDVLQDLVDSGDLDAGYLDDMPVFTVGRTASLEWTPAAMTSSSCPSANGALATPCEYPDPNDNTLSVYCVSPSLRVNTDHTPAPHHTRCSP